MTPEILHMGDAKDWLALNKPSLTVVDTYVRNPDLGPMGATHVRVFKDMEGKRHRYELSNGGCSLFLDV